jgi:anion-transporting  ArsA/GET3 family ATPase
VTNSRTESNHFLASGRKKFNLNLRSQGQICESKQAPETLPIAVIKRFINWFHDFGIPVGGVIVNMLIDKAQVRSDSPEFVRNRVAMQDIYMAEIWSDFDNLRAIVPLFDNEVRGTESLKMVADFAFPQPVTAVGMDK